MQGTNTCSPPRVQDLCIHRTNCYTYSPQGLSVYLLEKSVSFINDNYHTHNARGFSNFLHLVSARASGEEKTRLGTCKTTLSSKEFLVHKAALAILPKLMHAQNGLLSSSAADGFWGSRHERAFFDVRVFNP